MGGSSPSMRPVHEKTVAAAAVLAATEAIEPLWGVNDTLPSHLGLEGCLLKINRLLCFPRCWRTESAFLHSSFSIGFESPPFQAAGFAFSNGKHFIPARP